MSGSDLWVSFAVPAESNDQAYLAPVQTAAQGYWADRMAGGLVFAERGQAAEAWRRSETDQLERLAGELVLARSEADEARRRVAEAGGGQRLRRRGALTELLGPWTRGLVNRDALSDDADDDGTVVTASGWKGRRAAKRVDPVIESRMRRDEAERYFVYHPEGRAEVTAWMVRHNARVDAAAPLVRKMNRAAAQVRALEVAVAAVAERSRKAALSVRLVGDPGRAAGWARLAVRAEEVLLPREGAPIARQTGVAALAATLIEDRRKIEYEAGPSVVRACVSEQVAQVEQARSRPAEERVVGLARAPAVRPSWSTGA
jgi:hypothetical protein